MLSLDILLFYLPIEFFFGGGGAGGGETFTKKTLNGGACSLNYSRAVLGEIMQKFWRKQDGDYTTTAWNHFACLLSLSDLGEDKL